MERREPVLSADAAFANAANAAVTAFAANPPYVAYRVDVRTNDGTAEKDARYQIVLRTQDDTATTTDANGKRQEGPPPVLPPDVDALAEWAFALDLSSGRPVMHVNYQEPRRYTFATPGPNVDAVVPMIRGFAVTYAADDANHVRLEPSTPEVKALAKQTDRYLYRDVWFEPATWLPTRVIVAAINGTLTLDYAVNGGHWLLAHMVYDVVNRSRRSTQHVTIEATFSDFTFGALPAPRSGV